jgi:hypothetical protein
VLRTLSILRFLQVRVFCGGWNPHRGFRHGGRSGSRGVGGVSGIVMTDCGAAHAIHPPIFWDLVFVEVGIRVAASDMAVVRVHAGLVVFRELS